MKGSITSKEDRTAGSIISFDIDESNYSPEASRVITKNHALDGTVITTNWGYPQGNKNISISNILLSRSNYEILIAMKEDDDYDFLFHYLTNTFAVVIRSASGNPAKDKVLVNMTLSVISKYTAMETAWADYTIFQLN